MWALRHDQRVLAVVCTLLLVMGAGPSAAGTAVDTVKVSFMPLQSFGGLFIAEREGYFAAERIKITWVPVTSSAQVAPLLVQGLIDVGAGSLSAGAFNAITRGQTLRVVADKGHIDGRGASGSLIVRTDLARTVKSTADLKGRKLGIAGVGALGHYVMAKALSAGRVPMDQVTLVTLSQPASVAALLSGAIDAAVLSPPLDVEAVETRAGFKLLDFADVLPGEPFSFLFFGPTLQDQQRAVGNRFMVAYLRGLQRYGEGPTPRNVAVVADYTKTDPSLIRKGGWVSIHPDGYVDAAKLRRFQDWLFEIGLIDVRNPISTVVDASFVEQARTALGLPGR